MMKKGFLNILSNNNLLCRKNLSSEWEIEFFIYQWLFNVHNCSLKAIKKFINILIFTYYFLNIFLKNGKSTFVKLGNPPELPPDPINFWIAMIPAMMRASFPTTSALAATNPITPKIIGITAKIFNPTNIKIGNNFFFILPRPKIKIDCNCNRHIINKNLTKSILTKTLVSYNNVVK